MQFPVYLYVYGKTSIHHPGLKLLGITIIHAANGWFVGEHATGGMEYSILLVATLFALAAAARK